MTSCRRQREHCEQDNDRSIPTLPQAHACGANLEQAMTAVRAIARANRSGEVCALLNVYSEAVRLSDHGTEMLDPIENALGAMRQMQALFIALGLASRNLEDNSRNAIKEALFVFNAALERLYSFPETGEERVLRQERTRERGDPFHLSEHGKSRTAADSRSFA
jgi:hypothetical protein